MPYQGDPLNIPTDEVRLFTGDIWPDMEYLTDNDYNYYLTRNDGNVRRAGLDAMRAILFKLSRGARERTGDIEVYGSEYFKNYLQALTLVIKNPDIAISLAVPYAGGISKSDMLANDMNCDNATRSIYVGFADHRKLYNQHNPGVQYTDSGYVGSGYWDTQFGGEGGGFYSGFYY